jgi:hypothetical protein
MGVSICTFVPVIGASAFVLLYLEDKVDEVLLQLLVCVVDTELLKPVAHTSAYVSIRQHTLAYVSIRQHTEEEDGLVNFHRSVRNTPVHREELKPENIEDRRLADRHSGHAVTPTIPERLVDADD